MTDWLNYIDRDLSYKFKQEELWHTSKTIALDSILALNYLRTRTDNLPITMDNRVQKLLDMCQTYCRNDYFHRFLKFDSDFYHNVESLWWIYCWESIRLNNILHELGIRNIESYFKTSEGYEFESKWEKFFKNANSLKYNRNSLPAFSYLECIRLMVNINKEIPIDDLKEFFQRLCEHNHQKCKLFPNSSEIRSKSISLIGSRQISFLI